MTKDIDSTQIKNKENENKEKIVSLLMSSKTLSLATINSQQEAELSLVPFYYDDNRFWIFISKLSAHTQHLFNHPECSVLIYENEASPKNCFAVERLSIACIARLINEDNDAILDKMTDKLGETLKLLRQLGDFCLFSLDPTKGRFIAGFGQAFDVEFVGGSEKLSLQHVNPSKKI